MTLKQTEQLLDLLRRAGVTYFKSHDLEVSFSSEPGPQPVLDTPKVVAPPPQAAPPVESSIAHHVNEVANLLKLDDMSLVDRLFPDYTKVDNGQD